MPTLRREVVGALMMVGVAAAAAAFAHLFRDSTLAVMGWLSGAEGPVQAAAALPRPVVLAVVTAAVLVAVMMNRVAGRVGNGRSGLSDVAASARGEGPGPSFRSTVVRSSATWIASAGMTSIGRESAIIETGGAVGFGVGKRLGRWAPDLAAAGIAAAFAAAYHAPIAALVYVEEHLQVRRSRRSAVYTLAGAGVGHLVSVRLLGGSPIFPGTQGSRSGMLVLGVIGLLPAIVGARVFLEGRLRLEERTRARTRRIVPRRVRPVVIACAVVSAAVVAGVPYVAGNGMEAIRAASQDAAGATIAVGLALGLGKLVATTGSLGSSAPGGALSPTIAIAAGWALLLFGGIEAIGVALPGAVYDGMLAAMAVGVAVGLRAPLMAIVLIPEMVGDLSLLLVCAAVVLPAAAADRLLDGHRGIPRRPARVPVLDEDA